MFDPTSRYYGIPVATMNLPQPDGSTLAVSYARRRFVPSPAGMTVLVQVAVQAGDRPDTITAATLHDPTQYWRVCDANLVMDPAELTAQPGRVVTIAMPQS
jgi:hypothetical protein